MNEVQPWLRLKKTKQKQKPGIMKMYPEAVPL